MEEYDYEENLMQIVNEYCRAMGYCEEPNGNVDISKMEEILEKYGEQDIIGQWEMMSHFIMCVHGRIVDDWAGYLNENFQPVIKDIVEETGQYPSFEPVGIGLN